MYRCGALRRVGVFDESLFFGFEEGEFGQRLRQAGYSIYADARLWQEWTRSRWRISSSWCSL